MPYAVQYDVPADERIYWQVKAGIGDEQPKGLVAHVVVEVDGGMRHIGVWDSPQDWQRFHDDRVEPAVRAALTAAGFTQLPPGPPPAQELKVIDVWLGA
jgi:hypothetical protein